MVSPGKAVPGGISFGPTQSGKMYFSTNQHRGEPTIHKSTWSEEITRDDEFAVFRSADQLICRDLAGNYWGIAGKGYQVLGTRHERFAKFPATINLTDPWHGYPVSPNRRGEMDAPPDSCIEIWKAADAIDRVWEVRLKRRAI